MSKNPELRLVYMKPEDIQPHEMNWRRHPQAQEAALSDLLGEVGWAGALLYNEATGRLIDGHCRRKVAKTRRDEKVPVLVGNWTEDQERKILATLDPIAAMATSDADALSALLDSVTTDSPDIQALLDSLAATLPQPETKDTDDPTGGGDGFDATPEPDGPTHTNVGELWLIGGKHRLLVGDCTQPDQAARLFGEAHAEMVWTDPPYGVSIGDKNKFLNSIAPSNRVEENLTNDSLDEPALAAMLSDAFDNAMAHCLPGAAWYVAAPAGPPHLLFASAMKERGILRQMLIWVKNNATFSPLGVSYHWRHEPVFYGWLPNGGHRYHGDRKQDTVWEIDRPQASPDHPTTKPLELVARAVEHSSLPGDIVYDPFLGSGTTLIAAHRLNRVAYGMEIDCRYADVILKRAEAEGLSTEKVS